jgi:hypothetical protein
MRSFTLTFYIHVCYWWLMGQGSWLSWRSKCSSPLVDVSHLVHGKMVTLCWELTSLVMSVAVSQSQKLGTWRRRAIHTNWWSSTWTSGATSSTLKQFLDVVLKYPVSFTNISCNKLNNMEVLGGSGLSYAIMWVSLVLRSQFLNVQMQNMQSDLNFQPDCCTCW